MDDTPKDCLVNFEYEPIGLQFECSHAVYPKGGETSLCYVTSEERAKFIVAALEYFKASGKLEEFYKENYPDHYSKHYEAETK